VPAAKEAAWAAVVESEELSNHLQVATMIGFGQVEQDELLEPFVGRYFDAVADLWRTRTMDTAQSITEMFFPMWSLREQTVLRVEDYLARNNPQPALRRSLTEGRDGLTRALAARARDSAG
jgi:aminopeptidase N